MIIDSRYFDDIYYLAEQLEHGDQFDMDLRMFSDQVKHLKIKLHQLTNDREVRYYLNRMPELEFSAHQRSFLEQMLPKGARNMVGKYRNREKIRAQVREITGNLEMIRRILNNDDYV